MRSKCPVLNLVFLFTGQPLILYQNRFIGKPEKNVHLSITSLDPHPMVTNVKLFLKASLLTINDKLLI